MPGIDEQYHTNLAALPPFSFPAWSLRPLAAMSRWLKPPTDRSGVDIIDTTTSDRLGEPLDVRVYVPAGTSSPLPCLVWLHGGGFVLGTHHDDAWGCGFARSAGIAVVSVGYRLAPDHPFPAALDDATTAVRWALAGAYGHVDATRVAIGGESAGGGLAACAVQRLHDEGIDLAGQLLVYPMLDDRTVTRPDIGRNQHAVWTNGSNRLGWTSYLGPTLGEGAAAYAVAARRADLTGLAPAWIGVGTEDLFMDEDLAYADRLRAAGVGCTTEVVDGAPHGFATLAPHAPGTAAFLAGANRFLVDHLT